MHPGVESTRDTIHEMLDTKIERKQQLNWQQKVVDIIIFDKG